MPHRSPRPGSPPLRVVEPTEGTTLPEPEKPRVLRLPTFRAPEPEPETETGEPIDLVPTEGPTLGPGSSNGNHDSRGSDSGSETVTPTKAFTRPDDPAKARNTSKLVANLLRMTVVIAEKLLSRNGRDFRRPTDAQVMGVARPVARIMVRHLDVSFLSDDVNDVIEAGGEASAWMLEGPVAPRRYTDRPDNLIGMEHEPIVPGQVEIPFPTTDPSGDITPTYLD